MPLRQAGGEVGRAEPEQLAVGVDLVVVRAPRRSWPRRAPRRSRPAGRRPRSPPSCEVVARRPRRRVGPSDGRPLSILPTMATPSSSRPSALTTAITPSTATSEPGTTGANRRRPSTTHERRERRRRASRPLRVAELAETRSQSCSKKSPSPFSTPKSFGTWPMMIVSARPTMKPLSTGSEMKLARKPSRRSAGDQRDDARSAIASAAVSVDEGGLARGGDGPRPPRRRGPRSRTSGRRRGGASCRRQRVEQQRGRRGVEADDRARRRRSRRRRAPRARARPRRSGRRRRRRGATRGRSRAGTS